MGPTPANKLARYRISDLLIDVGSRRVTRGGEPLKVGGLTFDLLDALAEAAPDMASYDDLAEKVWKGRPVTPETIAQRAKMLRDALGDDARNPRYFEPVRGQGYRMCSAAEAAVPPGKSGRTKSMAALLGLAVVVAVSLAGAWYYLSSRPISVAVLPVEVFTDDAGQQAFADELTVAIIHRLHFDPDQLIVTSQISSSAFKGMNMTARELGAKLDVDYLLSVSLKQSGDEVRASIELIDARDETCIYCDTIVRRLQDRFELQDEIANVVAEALEITFGVGALGTRPGMTDDIDAHDLYVQALHERVTLFTDTERSLIRAIALLERAIELDSGFALAWLQKSQFYFQAAQVARGISPERRLEWLSRSTFALERALELAPDSVEVAALAAEHALHRGDWSEADGLLTNLISNHSGSVFESDIFRVHGMFLRSQGSPGEAIPVLERVGRLDRYNSRIQLQLGDTYLAAGKFEAALEAYDRGLELRNNPSAMLLGSSLVAAVGTGDKRLIAERVERMSVDPDPGTELNLKLVALLDNPAAALVELRQFEHATANHSALSISVRAAWAAYFDDPTYALDLLNRVPPPMENWVLANVIWRPAMANVRSLPGFNELVEKMGLTDFWREAGWPEMCWPTDNGGFACR